MLAGGFSRGGGGFREAPDGAKASDCNVGGLPASVAAGTAGKEVGLLSYRVSAAHVFAMSRR